MKLPPSKMNSYEWRGFRYGNGQDMFFAFMDFLGWGMGLAHKNAGSGNDFICYLTHNGGGHGNGAYPVGVLVL